MAVKVMIAPAIAQRDAEPPAKKDPEARPKKRRTSVYDADGNEVFLTLMCLKCHKMRPLSQFGLRRMADGAIRNQPWCRSCRNGASAGSRARAKSAAGSAVVEDLSGEMTTEKVIDPGALGAQVMAALHGGRRG
jgi:hypothetical protein